MATTYLLLDLPTPSVTLGPTYASQIVEAFEVIDEHDHSSGKGVRIPTAGISIDADLELNDFSLTEAKSVKLSRQSSALTGAEFQYAAHNVLGDFYWTNAAGNAVQITDGDTLNAASLGGIGGDYATSDASVSYSEASNTFTFTRSSGFPALLDSGDIHLKEASSGITKYVNLKSPSSLAATYAWTFPAALPASTSLLTLSSAGQVASTLTPTVTTLTTTGNVAVGSSLSVTSNATITGNVSADGNATVLGTAVINGNTTVSGVLSVPGGDPRIRHGEWAFTIPAITGLSTSAGSWLFDGTNYVRATTGTVPWIVPLVLQDSKRVKTVGFYLSKGGGSAITVTFQKVDTTGSVTVIATDTYSTSGDGSISLSGLTETVDADYSYYAKVLSGQSTDRVYHVTMLLDSV